MCPRNRGNFNFPLRQFVRCGHCGKPLTASFSRGRHGGRYGYYHCVPKGCVRAPKARLEQDFIDQLKGLRPHPELVTIWRRIVLDVWEAKKAELNQDVSTLERRVSDLKRRRKVLARAFLFDKAIEQADYEELLAEVKEDLLIAELALHEAKIDDLDIVTVLNFAEQALTSAAKIWLEADLDQRQRFQALLFPEGLTYTRQEGVGTPKTISLFSNLAVHEAAVGDGIQPEGVGTPEPAFVFNELRGDLARDKGLVEQRGLEPPTPTMRTWCSPS